MKSRAPDPLHLDVASFAADAGEMAGEWPADALSRLHASQTPPQDLAPGPVRWHVRGEHKPVAGGPAELWLHLRAEAEVWLTCQRCLQPLALPLALEAPVRFVRGESQAEALDAECEYDVLALPKALDLRELMEDELLLALPIVPRHEHCPQPLPMVVDAPLADEAPASENPFAVLAALRRPGP